MRRHLTGPLVIATHNPGKLKELRELMLRNSDNVGTKFAEEARRMHFGEIEHRAIHGEADREQVVALLEDGIEVMPLPGLPEERN